MYHIKDDKRCQKSTNLIIKAVMELLQEKDLHEITISEVQDRSTISRATFYRNFDELSDVMLLLCDQGFEEIFSQFSNSSDIELADLPELVFRYWFEHSAILEALIRSRRTDVLYSSLHHFVKKLDIISWLAEDNRSIDYLVSIVSYTMIGIIVEWVENGKKEGMHELGISIKEAFEIMSSFGLFLKNEKN